MIPENETRVLLVDEVQSINYEPPAPGALFATTGARLDLDDGTLLTSGLRSDDTGVTARSFTLAADLDGAPDVALDDDTLLLPGGDYFATSLSASSANGVAFVAWLTDDTTDETDAMLLRAGDPAGSQTTMLLGPDSTFITLGDPTEANRFAIGATIDTTGPDAELASDGDSGSAFVRITSTDTVLDATIGVVTDDFADYSNISTTDAGITLRSSGPLLVELDGAPSGELFGTWLGHVQKTGSSYVLTTSYDYVGDCEVIVPAMGRDGVAVVTWNHYAIATGATVITSRIYRAIGAGAFAAIGTTAVSEPTGAVRTTSTNTVHVPTTAGETTTLRLYALRSAAGGASIIAFNTTISVTHHC